MKMTNQMLRRNLRSEDPLDEPLALPTPRQPAATTPTKSGVSGKKIPKEQRAQIAKEAYQQLMGKVKEAIRFTGSIIEVPANSNFRPELCDMLIEIMANTGCTLTEALQTLGVHQQTSQTWTNNHPEWARAIAEGHLQAEAWWWRCGRMNLGNPYFNNTLYIYMTANRFHLRRQDPVRVEGSVNVNNQTETKILNVNVLRQLTDDQLKVLESISSTILTVPENGDAPRLGNGMPQVKPAKVVKPADPVEEEVL